MVKKIYDISQEVFGCNVFPGDSLPHKDQVSSIEDGALCNLTNFSMCAHNGTHVDAPFHFIKDGKTIDKMDLNKFVGAAYVYTKNGELYEEEALQVINMAKNINQECAKRLLFRGTTVITEEAARVFAKESIYLIGNESQTVGPLNAPMQVHLILLEKEIVLLEGICLSEVPDGMYLLNAVPMNLGGADGAPCRAILMELD